MLVSSQPSFDNPHEASYRNMIEPIGLSVVPIRLEFDAVGFLKLN